MRILIKEKLSEHKSKTPEGYLICQDAILARTGSQEYLKSEIYEDFDGEDTVVSVERKPEQVFSAEALASFEDKPITVEHPDESVNPDNYSELAVGHTRNIRKGKFNGQDVMIGDLIITDAQTIEDIENGIRTELSCGYDCDITEGDNPEQINIRGNHIALCEQGRAGIAKIIDSKNTKDNRYKNAKALLQKKGPYYTIDLKHDRLIFIGKSESLVHRTSDDWESNKYRDITYDSLDEAMEDARKLFNEFKNKKEITHREYTYYSVMVIKWSDGSGISIDENGKDLGIFPVFSAYDEDELPEKIYKKIEYTKDSLTKDVNPKKGETKEEFISRFMEETKNEYQNKKQRLAVAYSYWDRAKKKTNDSSLTFEEEIIGDKYIEMRWDKYDGYVVIIGDIVGEMVRNTETHHCYSKENAKKVFDKYKKKLEKHITDDSKIKDYSAMDAFGKISREKYYEIFNFLPRFESDLIGDVLNENNSAYLLLFDPSRQIYKNEDGDWVATEKKLAWVAKSLVELVDWNGNPVAEPNESTLKEDSKKSLDRKDKHKLSKYFASISKHLSNDISIEDIINPIKEMGFEPIRDHINGWNKMDDGYYRKDYFFTLDGYNDLFMVSLYAKGDGNWDVDEVNAYFVGKKEFDDSILQEYEQIRRSNESKYGKDFMEYVERYLDLPENKVIVENKLSSGYVEKRPKLLLSDLYYKKDEWDKFMSWYQKEKQNKSEVKDNQVDYNTLRAKLLNAETVEELKELKEKIENYYDRDLLNEVEYKKLIRTFENMDAVNRRISTWDSENNIEEKLDLWMQKLEDYHTKKSPFLKYKFYYVYGKKWIKIVGRFGIQEGVFAFVDPETGDIYKAASWSTPAKGVRGHIDNPPMELSQLYRDAKDIDYKEFIYNQLNPEQIYEDEDSVTVQFASEADAKKAIDNSSIKNLGYNIISDESAYYLIYNKDDISSFFSKKKDLPKSKINSDAGRYVIYAKGTWENNRALFWMGRGPARYMNEADAPTFTKEYAEKVERSNGAYTWVKAKVNDLNINDSNSKYVIYNENGIFKGTSLENYNAQHQDANEITIYKDFETLEQIVSYLLKYTDLKRNDIITIGDNSIGDVRILDDNYPKHFYKKSIDLLKKKLKNLDKVDDGVLDENKKDYNNQKNTIYAEIKKQIDQYENKLLEDDDSVGIETNIKEWYCETFPDDKSGKTLNDNVTFDDLFNCLDNYKDVYECLGGEADSVIRERCFKKLAKIIDSDYDYIYEQWLKANE